MPILSRLSLSLSPLSTLSTLSLSHSPHHYTALYETWAALIQTPLATSARVSEPSAYPRAAIRQRVNSAESSTLFPPPKASQAGKKRHWRNNNNDNNNNYHTSNNNNNNNYNNSQPQARMHLVAVASALVGTRFLHT